MDRDSAACAASPPAAPSQPVPERKVRKKKRRGGVGGKPVRKPPKPKHADCQPPRERSPDQRVAEIDTRDLQTLDRLPSIVERLPDLWADNYDASVEREKQENDAMGMTQGAWLMQGLAPVSTYQLHNRQSAELATVRDARDQRMRRKWAASARHSNNQRDTPFSMLARSIGMLGRRMSNKNWLEDRSLLSRATAEHYLFLLTPVRPPPAFSVATQVSAYVWDQFYIKEHCNGKNGEYRGRKSITSTGLTHEWHKITNINTLEVSCHSPSPILCHASHAFRAHVCGRL